MTAEHFKSAAAKGWCAADAGEYEEALNWYELADDIASRWIDATSPAIMSPELCLSRHKEGKVDGFVKPMPPTEDAVLSVEFQLTEHEANSAYGLKSPVGEGLSFEGYKIADRFKTEAPHIQVLSTGRCGTISLYHLFEQSQYIPYHSYFFMASQPARFEMMCRHLASEPIPQKLVDEWIAMRCAEWWGCGNIDRPMITLNHLDTVYAPLFSQVHPNSKFIYLHRDPEKIFRSFYTKRQWTLTQLCPVHYDFDPFRWKRKGVDIPAQIAWYIKFTENFCRKFGEIMGDRFIEISADKLFDTGSVSGIDEAARLIAFTNIDMSLGDVGNHFMQKYNEKAHKIVPEINYDAGLEVFRKAYAAL